MITVIIPTCCPGDYLWDCLNSLQKQSLSFEQFEVLLILNGERDPYYTQIENYLDRLILPVRFFYIANVGVSCARNFALNKARGKYIAFIDDDDTISSDYLSTLLGAIILEKSRTIVCSNVKTVDKDSIGDDYITQSYNKINRNNIRYSLLAYRHFLSVCWGKLIPVSIIDNKQFSEAIRIGEDSLFMASISDKIEHIVLGDPSAIYYRRIRPGSASRKRERTVDKLKRKWNLLVQYGRLYVNGFPHYNLPFFLSRIVAIIVK